MSRQWTRACALAAAVVALAMPATRADTVRPVIPGFHGMVAANHPLAAMVGLRVLMNGGNAVDAAVATAAALGVVEPFASGLGGDGFAVIYMADPGEVYALNFSGRVPSQLTAAAVGRRIPTRGPLVSVVPGALAGWEAARSRFGTKGLAELLQPAIELAERGYPLTEYGRKNHEMAAGEFAKYGRAGAEAWWGGAEIPPPVGQLVRNPRLADTYRRIAAGGADVFYRGEIADAIVEFVRRHGGVLTKEDMAQYAVEWTRPLSVTYRDCTVFAPPLNSTGGMAALQILNLMEGFDVPSMGLNQPAYVHTLVEAIKLAAADRAVWDVDPAYSEVPVPTERLLSKPYAEERRRLIDPARASSKAPAGIEREGTTHLTVVDGQGNMVSLTTTIGSFWGSGVVAGSTGVVLNNAVYWFESPASIQAGRRPPYNQSPMVVLKGGRPFLAMGTPGGVGIWQTLPQVLLNIVEFGMGIQEAIESPRFMWSGAGLVVDVESRIPEDVRTALTQLGHKIRVQPEYTSALGSINGILVDADNGVLLGGADPRRDGYVVGW